MSDLSAHDLLEQLRQSLSCERAALADFLVALAELDRRRLFVELGWSAEAAGKSTRQVEQMVAWLDSKPVPRDVVQRTDELVSRERQRRRTAASLSTSADGSPENAATLIDAAFPVAIS